MKTIESINMEDFCDKAKRAKDIAEIDNYVQYDFNGITCTVSPSTEIEWLFRDYINAGYTKNKSIGPDCKIYVDADTINEVSQNKIIAADNHILSNILREINSLYAHIKENPTHLGKLFDDDELWNVYRKLDELKKDYL